MNTKAFFYDIKKLFSEPILLLFMCVPFLAILAVKCLLLFGMPIITRCTGFVITPYLGYIDAFMLLLSPGMLGAVAAFMMIDERDGGIYELMSVTPLGFSGYIANRLLMPFVLSIVYTIDSHLILNCYTVAPIYLLAAALLSGMQAITTGLILFSIADDKVKGLTLAKALDSLMLTAAADLLGIRWLSIISSLSPFYWTSKILVAQSGAAVIIMGIAVNALWVGIALAITVKRR